MNNAPQNTKGAPVVVILGASGDLTSRKLIPALFRLYQKGRLPAGTCVVGFSRTPFTDDAWRENLAQSTSTFTGAALPPDAWRDFAQRIYYVPGDIQKTDDFTRLSEQLSRIEKGQPSHRVYYLSTSPEAYQTAISQLGAAGLAEENGGSRRVVIEKPFGTDLKTAVGLNEAVHSVFSERQVYRIDHYLGKETVQNLLVLRFANSIFEPIWNRNYINHVQITAAEEVTVGRRAAFYESAGVLRDMFQNHLLQLLMITAMEPPNRLEADAIRNEKVKVLEAVRPLSQPEISTDSIRGQYAGYLQEPGVAPNSQVATFGAIKLHVDNWRWKNVPFYLRSGKAMSCRTTQIVIQFHRPPHLLFGKTPTDDYEPNRLVIQIQPAEGIQMHLQSKVPDQGMQLRLTSLDFRFDSQFRGTMPEAYERLLLDVLMGDPSLFARSDEVEHAWKIVDQFQQAWDGPGGPPLFQYVSGEWGPTECTDWMSAQGRQWFDTCPILRP